MAQAAGPKPRRKRVIDYPRHGKHGIRRWLPSWKLVFGSFLTACLLLVGGFAAAVAFTKVPKPNDIAMAEQSIIYWNDGKTELGRLGEANRVAVDLKDIPLKAQEAVLAAEDRSYYEHGGFDPRGLARAVWVDLSDGQTQGGSTITQQYAKNAFLTHEQTISRKVRELFLSVKLETEESKSDILNSYLNTIYWGRGAYGIETASQAYFGVSAKDLNLRQSAALAAIIRAPGGYDPETHKDQLKARYAYVLDGMVAKGWITPEEKAHAVKKLPQFVDYEPQKSSLRGTKGYLIESVRREMLRRGFTENDLTIGGYRIVSTFDRSDQKAAVNAVDWSGPGPEKGLRIGLTAVDPKNGEVRAMYGGADYLKNQLSNADQAVGLAGSTFKAFGLAAAFEDDIDLSSTWDGSSPRTIKGYKLQNEDNVSYGQVSLLRATEKSINTVFVDLAQQVGVEKVREAAVRAGVPDKTIGLVADPTTVLGTASPTTLDMASAYATFANEGERIEPTTIQEVTRAGQLEYKHEVEPQRAFSADVSNKVTYALEQVVRSGTGTAARALGRPAAGKTGTTDNNRSAWFVGYTPQLSAAVMMVKQDKDGNAESLYGTGGMGHVFGGSYPTRIWTTFMQQAMAGREYEDFTPPDEYAYGGYYDQYSNPTPSDSASPTDGVPASPNAEPTTAPTNQSASAVPTPSQ